MEITITRDIQNSWIFQDERKFKWWVDLWLLADENGEIHMSLGDLVKRWEAPKTTVYRFLEKLSQNPIGGTKVEHQAEQIAIYSIGSYEGVRNTKRNKSGTIQESPLSSLSPTPPISTNPKEFINNNLNTHTRTREDKIPWEANREKAYKERFVAQGCGMTASRATGKNAAQIMTMIDAFMAKCELGDFGHKDFGHFNNHFLQFIKNPENSINDGRNIKPTDRRVSAGVSAAEDIVEPF